MLCGRCTPKNLQPEPHPCPRPIRPAPSHSRRGLLNALRPLHTKGLTARAPPLPPAYSACPLPLPEGAFNYFKPYRSTHLLCVRAHPRQTSCLCEAYRLPPSQAAAMAWGQAHALAKVIGLRTKKIHKRVHQNVLTLFTITL